MVETYACRMHGRKLVALCWHQSKPQKCVKINDVGFVDKRKGQTVGLENKIVCLKVATCTVGTTVHKTNPLGKIIHENASYHRQYISKGYQNLHLLTGYLFP